MVDEPVETTVRPATTDDADAIGAVHVASWRQAYATVVSAEHLAGLDPAARAEQWRARLAAAPPGTSVWVAEVAGRVVGFVSTGPSRDDDAEHGTLEIDAIYLEPRAWGQGAARALIRTVLEHAGPTRPVTLWALAANDRARHFYRRSGFVTDGVERMEQLGEDAYLEVRYRRR